MIAASISGGDAGSGIYKKMWPAKKEKLPIFVFSYILIQSFNAQRTQHKPVCRTEINCKTYSHE
jgi:hypothetical protein